MNYIELINLFWQTRRICKLTSNEADLYFCLLNESNIRGWENPFECRNDVICSSISMSEKTLIDVRNRLQQKGLITFVAGQRKKKSPVYTILYWNKVNKTPSKTVDKTENRTGNKTVAKTPNLLYKQETKTKTKESRKPTVSPFTPPTVEEIKNYCSERKNNIDAQKFADYYQAVGWVIGAGGKKMKDWRASVRTWEKRTFGNETPMPDAATMQKTKAIQQESLIAKEKAKQIKEAVQQQVSEKIKSSNPDISKQEYFGRWDNEWKKAYCLECEKQGIHKTIYNQLI